MPDEKTVWMARTQAVGGFAVHAEESMQAPGFACLHGQHHADAEHQNICNQHGRSHWCFLFAKNSREFLAQSREGKSQARAALVAACRADSH